MKRPKLSMKLDTIGSSRSTTITNGLSLKQTFEVGISIIIILFHLALLHVGA